MNRQPTRSDLALQAPGRVISQKLNPEASELPRSIAIGSKEGALKRRDG